MDRKWGPKFARAARAGLRMQRVNDVINARIMRLGMTQVTRGYHAWAAKDHELYERPYKSRIDGRVLVYPRTEGIYMAHGLPYVVGATRPGSPQCVRSNHVDGWHSEMV